MQNPKKQKKKKEPKNQQTVKRNEELEHGKWISRDLSPTRKEIISRVIRFETNLHCFRKKETKKRKQMYNSR